MDRKKKSKFEDVLLIMLVFLLLLGMFLTVKFGTAGSLHSYIQEKPASTDR